MCGFVAESAGANARIMPGLESGVQYVSSTSWSMRGTSRSLISRNCRLIAISKSIYVQSYLSSSKARTKHHDRIPCCLGVSFPSAIAMTCISMAVCPCPAAEKQKATGDERDIAGLDGSLPLRGFSISIIGWKRGRAFT